MPIYQGGSEYSAIRQNKETLGQKRIDLDTNRDQARATVTQSWGQLQAAKAQIEATTAQVNAWIRQRAALLSAQQRFVPLDKPAVQRELLLHQRVGLGDG